MRPQANMTLCLHLPALALCQPLNPVIGRPPGAPDKSILENGACRRAAASKVLVAGRLQRKYRLYAEHTLPLQYKREREIFGIGQFALQLSPAWWTRPGLHAAHRRLLNHPACHGGLAAANTCCVLSQCEPCYAGRRPHTQPAQQPQQLLCRACCNQHADDMQEATCCSSQQLQAA
jgi:hypothetical protein